MFSFSEPKPLLTEDWAVKTNRKQVPKETGTNRMAKDNLKQCQEFALPNSFHYQANSGLRDKLKLTEHKLKCTTVYILYQWKDDLCGKTHKCLELCMPE